MTIRLRKADQSDANLVATFVEALLTELEPGAACSSAELEETTSLVLSNASIIGILAFDDDAPIGALMLNECAAIYAGGSFGEITELYVSPEYRSQGVASSLIEAAIETGNEKGWKRLEVGAPDQPTWERTLKFYLREGFEETGPRLRKKL